MSAHREEPWEVEEIQNDGLFGGGPNPRSGFKSFAICDSLGRVLFDSLNRDTSLCEIYEEDDSAWDELAKRDARRIVACVNACAGVSTDDLEATTRDSRYRHEIITDLVACNKQRGDLLAAAKNLRDVKGRFHTEQAMAGLLEAISKVEAKP